MGDSLENPYRTADYAGQMFELAMIGGLRLPEVRAWFFIRLADGGPPTPLFEGKAFGLAG
jgi:hypothetical protein